MRRLPIFLTTCRAIEVIKSAMQVQDISPLELLDCSKSSFLKQRICTYLDVYQSELGQSLLLPDEVRWCSLEPHHMLTVVSDCAKPDHIEPYCCAQMLKWWC